MADGKSILIGMVLGAVAIVAIESAVLVLMLQGGSASGILGMFSGLKNATALPVSLPTSTHNATTAMVEVHHVNVTGNMHVNGVGLADSAALSGALSYSASLPGFNATPGNTVNYTVKIPNYSSLKMLVYAMGSETANFSVPGTHPAAPVDVAPNSNRSVTFEVVVPSSAFDGNLDLNFSALLSNQSQ